MRPCFDWRRGGRWLALLCACGALLAPHAFAGAPMAPAEKGSGAAAATPMVSESTSDAATLTPVTLQLKWQHQFQFAGYYAAAARGYYRDVGLDVRFQEADGKHDPTDAVFEGRAEFGVGNSDLLLRFARGQKPVVLAVIFQHSPLAMMMLDPSGVGSLHSIAGRPVMIEPAAAELFAYLRREGLAPGSFTLVPHGFHPDDLRSGKVEAMSVYSTDEPFLLTQSQTPFALYSPRTSGIDFYGDNLFTTEQMVNERPAVVAAFRQASLRGWHYAMEHQEEIIDLILQKYSQRKSRDHLRYEAAHMAPLVQPGPVDIGYTYPGRWQHIADIYAELGMLPPGISLDGLLYEPDAWHIPRWMTWMMFGLLGAVLSALLFSLQIFHNNRRLATEASLRRQIEASLQLSERRYRTIYEEAPLAFILLDRGAHVAGWNSNAERIFGWNAGEMLGRSIERMVIPEDMPKVREVLDQVLIGGGVRHSVNHNLTRDGRVIVCEWSNSQEINADGEVIGVLCLAQDATERFRMREELEGANQSLRTQIAQIQALQSQLLEQTLRDPLTGVFNRRYLEETRPREFARAQREGYAIAFLFLDIDRFKQINDELGHEVGDDALRQVAALLLAHARTEDIVCRFGGDEFIVLLPNMAQAAALARARQICAACAELTLGSGEGATALSVSIGVALYPEHGQTDAELARAADLALYAAKSGGRNRVALARTDSRTPTPGDA
ncbi:diguanylate cyclase [Rhodocyclus gracilis]|uniref:diguanylate cyclase n=1 Tax=Rhodocyclus tenuis TaxID=1066 RepID=A0A6L5JVG4_RHOTE|nr:diguanylate cyclase [Rhodocyclus gracilis]MQY51367.1 diguanylate cyclase [Rhodocyclus gracilis]